MPERGATTLPEERVAPPQDPDELDPIGWVRTQLTLRPLRVVARGGMGIVYEADAVGAEGFTKRVALKTLRQKWCADRRFMELLVAEAKLVAGLVHENIAQVHQLGRLKDGRHYLVMEYVHGLSLYDLQRRLRQAGVALPTNLAIHIASRVARGLGYAHDFRDRDGACLQVVHRDVCPSNILVSTEGLTKLIDFGVAKARTLSVISDDCRMGKIAYMPPEQALRKGVDYRADIYALGAVLFELLADRPLRTVARDASIEDLVAAPIPTEALRDDVDSELRSILDRMLAPEPDQRFPSANELARCLEEYIYRGGYGPTVQTVEAFLRQHCPDLYVAGASPRESNTAGPSTLTLPA